MAKSTIRDVARLAGVSVGTVSRVLNGHPNVKDSTREQVKKTIRSLEYEPDAAARELSGTAGITFGLNCAPGTKRLTPYFFLFVENLRDNARADGYRFEEIDNLPNGLPSRLADAMILFGAHEADPRIDFLEKSSTPFVLLGHGDGFPSVSPDDHDGGWQAGQHLIRLGHKNLLYVGGFMRHQAFHDRYSGFREALAEAGIAHDPQDILDGGFTPLGAYRALTAHLKTKRPFSGIFCSSDEMALGCLAALEDAELRVPADVSVVGYDDLPEIGEGLTTIHQDIPELSRTTLSLVMEAIRGEPWRHVNVPVQLVARGSTAAKRS